MSAKELFSSCRRGDLPRVQYLVEQKEVDLNIHDKWDTTPLYYACLCGHEELVKYLLDMGARCEVNTFEGERCMYGALSNSIRNLLKNYKQVTSSTMRRNVFTEFMRRLMDRGSYSDVTFIVHGEHYSAHKCVLSARSKYFQDLFKTKWEGKDVVHLTHKLIIPSAFKTLLSWLYTGHLEVHLDDVEDVIRLAKQCQLDSLMEDLKEELKKVLSFVNKPGTNVTVLSLEPSPDCTDLREDFTVLADLALPPGFCYQVNADFPFIEEEGNIYPDIIFSVEGHFFHCHKAFFMCRSDYFKALEEDHFGEYSLLNCDDCTLPVIPLSGVSATVFAQVMNYIYQDKCELTGNTVSDILVAADIYLLPGLKRYCGLHMTRYTDTDNVVNMLRTARMFNLPKLEDESAEFIANNIERMLQSQEFSELVQEDASTVQKRQETDSIPIIDDVRFHLTNNVQTFSDMYDTDKKLANIETFLETLHLDG